MENIEEFLNGNSFDSYHYFGAHYTGNGYLFRVYAPHAKRVELIGDFNNWDGHDFVMNKVEWQGVFELFIPNIPEYTMYKYRIVTKNNQIIDKGDPYGFYSELRPGGSSKTFNLEGYEWQDGNYLENRTFKGKSLNLPVNIYEMHLNGWKQKKDGSSYSYEEMIPELVPYLKKHHFTHVEFLPLMEHPMDKSWGYQVTGFYSITSRYGEPKQLMKLIDALHQAGIGVIFDFVGVHLVKDEFGLTRFDGTYLYEYSEASRRDNEWGTSNFDYNKGQTKSFLISCINFYCDYYHVDGIRMDAVSNIIYYRGNKNKGVNEGGIAFLKDLNIALHKLHPNVMMIAEDSSDYQGVTKPVYTGGLGFDYKWDLGWMHDTLEYYAKDPIYRKYECNHFAFSMYYFYSENFLLPLSHDEVVHGKGEIVDKMWGSYEDKFHQLRNLYVYMFTHPGKKLNFMGNEIAHFREFDETKPVDWFLLDYPMHQQFANFFDDLTKIYLDNPVLYEHDYEPLGFHYPMANNGEQCIFYYYREDGKDAILTILNMTMNSYDSYDIGVPYPGKYQEILNSEQQKYGGSGGENGTKVLVTKPGKIHDCSNKITLKIVGYSAQIIKYLGK
ncbi:MAG: 1,4-alpha-glucan branching protein GlgB [Bacilli bacterium]|nr:1,4-alpha-glucan branching protein GlgB [Bacilli bacterium]